jgi:hypothetical protein
VTALFAKALAVLATSSWAPVPMPDATPVRDPLPRHHRRPKPDPPPMSTATASYYTEHGTGACGLGPDVQAGYRFASLILAVRHPHAEMADRGPFISGRTFDLNVNLRRAISCGDLCLVRWRLQ